MRARGERISRGQWLAFFALCLLGASEWVVSGAWASPLPASEQQGLRYFVTAVVLFAVGWKRVGWGSLRERRWWRLCFASVCLLGLPALAAGLSDLGDVTVAALFALLPVMVVVLVSAFGAGVSRLLLPASIGLAGMLFLLPVGEPGSLRVVGLEGICLAGVLIAAGASVWMYGLLGEFAVIEAAVICSSANAVFFLVMFLVSSVGGGSGWGGEWSWRDFGVEAATAICFVLPQIVLLVWLMREIVPERFAARYLVVPLLTVIEGYAATRPELPLRLVGGAALAIFGAWRLMTASGRDEKPGLVLR